MLKRLQEYLNKKGLKDTNYAYMFDVYDGDEYVVFDCETTSLNVKKAEILSIGAVKIKGNKILSSQSLDLFVKPTKEIDSASIKIHHIRHCDLENALDSADAIKEFLNFVGNRPLIGYYLEFDVKMINKYLKPLLGFKLPNRQIEVSGLYFDKKIGLIPQGHVDLRFDTISADLDIPMLGKHSALNDAIMTAMIFLKLN
jgi:DNA polymerase-3 subunit epsilon